MKTSNVTSSQKCPAVLCFNPRRNPSSAYQHMFLEDFCKRFSIDLAKDKEHQQFYDVLPEKSLLKGLLISQNYDFLEYDLDKLLAHIMRTLIFAGKAFVEVVLSSDEENTLTGVSLVPFDPVLSIPSRNSTYFVAIQRNWKLKFFRIDNRNIISFRLSDFGFRRYSLKYFYNKLPLFDLSSVGDMSLSPQRTGFDFPVWKDKCDYKLLKASKNIGWHGHSTDNSYMGDAYLLYRAIQCKSLRRRFLDYFLGQINQSISAVCEDNGINGAIIAKKIDYDYDELLKKLNSGEINYSQLGDCVFRNKDILT